MDDRQRNFEDGWRRAVIERIGWTSVLDRALIEDTRRKLEMVKAQLKAMDEAYPELWIRKQP